MRDNITEVEIKMPTWIDIQKRSQFEQQQFQQFIADIILAARTQWEKEQAKKDENSSDSKTAAIINAWLNSK